RLGLEGLSENADDLRHPLASGTEGGAATAAAAVHAVDQSRDWGARREYFFCRNGKNHRAGPGRAGARQDHPALLGSRCLRGHARHHYRGYKVRVRPGQGRETISDRRGPHAGLLAFLAARPISSGFQSTVVRQAVRPRLARSAEMEQEASCALIARRRVAQDRREIRRSTQASDCVNDKRADTKGHEGKTKVHEGEQRHGRSISRWAGCIGTRTRIHSFFQFSISFVFLSCFSFVTLRVNEVGLNW